MRTDPFRAAALLVAAWLAGPTIAAPAVAQTAEPPAARWLPLPAAAATLERIGFGSCARQNRPQPIWDAVLAARPQLFLMIGDNVYGDVTSSAMRELEAAYAALDAHADFARARARLPFLGVWDDHDYGSNDAGGAFAHRAKAEALFHRFWQVPADDPRRSRPGLYTARLFGPPGRRVQIILLDTRSFRSTLARKPTRAPGTGPYVPDPDPTKTMLGPRQWAWLEGELSRPADLRLVVSSIQVLAQGHDWERWDTLPGERQRLFGLIARTEANGVVFLSGDRHVGALYRLADAVPYPLHEITSSSLNQPFPKPGETGPQQLGSTYGGENFGMVRIDWAAGRVRLELWSLDGKVVGSRDIDLTSLRP